LKSFLTHWTSKHLPLQQTIRTTCQAHLLSTLMQQLNTSLVCLQQPGTILLQPVTAVIATHAGWMNSLSFHQAECSPVTAAKATHTQQETMPETHASCIHLPASSEAAHGICRAAAAGEACMRQTHTHVYPCWSTTAQPKAPLQCMVICLESKKASVQLLPRP
jgi:hypothetical protein